MEMAIFEYSDSKKYLLTFAKCSENHQKRVLFSAIFIARMFEDGHFPKK